MTDEEKKAIRMLEFIVNHNSLLGYKPENRQALAEYIINLIEKQQENYQSCMDYADSLNKDIGELLLILEKKDKIINAMAKYIADIDITENMCPTCKYRNTECTMQECVESIIEYFEKKVGE